jgi:hypothetical protein
MTDVAGESQEAGGSGQGQGGSSADDPPPGGPPQPANAPLNPIAGTGQNSDKVGRLGSSDASPGSPTFEDEPWFARLPAEVRAAIRAKSQRRAPKAYEEKLGRYFQSID